LADGSTFALANSGERAFNYFDWEIDGLTLTASGSYNAPAIYDHGYTTAGGTAYSTGDAMKGWAYLDQGNAGLGVCHAGLDTDDKGTNQCNPGSDDNVTINEILKIAFDALVMIDFSETDFRDAGHDIFDPMIQISVDGGLWGLMDLDGMYSGEMFEFRVEEDGNQFYIDALAVNRVPEPASVMLLMLGLLGMTIARKQQS